MRKEKIILITGSAGFIGYHLCESLLKKGFYVIGLDNVSDYYDVNLKYDRLLKLGIIKEQASRFNKIVSSQLHGKQMQFIRTNINNKEVVFDIFKKNRVDIVCNLAAQAGVRYSLKNPKLYIESNINGFFTILESVKHFKIKRFIYASSSSVYGNSSMVPFSEKENVNKPISLYAATKKSNELMAYTYSHLYNIETIGLRFFTVYGPWGRPDMAMFLFTNAILNNETIKVFNKGNLFRDFTYIDDIIEGLVNTIIFDSKNDSNYKLYNIGNSNPVKLTEFIKAIEKELGLKAKKEMLSMQPGDVNKTWADVSSLENDYNYKPITPITLGVSNFIKWFKSYYSIN